MPTKHPPQPRYRVLRFTLVPLLFSVVAAAATQDATRPRPVAPAPPEVAPPKPERPAGARQVESETFPDDPRIAIVRRLLGDHQYSQAKVVIETILKEHPGLGRAEFFLGVTLTKLKQYEQARPHFENAIKTGDLFPERKHAHHFMAWASYHLGQLVRAKSEFEAHIALVGEEPDSIFALGVIAFDEDKLDEAEARFKRAIDLQSAPGASKRDVAKAWARLGDVSMRRDQAAIAEDQFMKSLAQYPDHYEVWAKLARARDRLGKAREAVSARDEEERARARVGLRPPEADDPALPTPTPPDAKPTVTAPPAAAPPNVPAPTKPPSP